MIHIMETNTENKFLINDIAPAFPVHPGSILVEELKARGISQVTFANRIGLQATHLSALIHGTRSFTAAVAEKIASGLEGISAEFWIKSQERYNLEKRRKSSSTSRLVTGYNRPGYQVQPAFLAEPQTAYNGNLQVILTIPEEDKKLMEALVGRLGWIWHQ